MDYITINRLARIEHEQRVLSLRPVPEYGQSVIECKSRGRRFPILLRPILTALLHFVIR